MWLPVPSIGDLHRDLSSRTQSASQLKAAIAAETRRLEATNAGVQDAQARLSDLQAQVDASQAQLASSQRMVVAARNRLTRLENRLHDAATLLASNLVASYKNPEPDVVSVVLDSHGFTDMLERLNWMRRIERRNARILSDTKAA